MRILQINTYDRGGGAEQVALSLHRAYRALGHDARMLVGQRRTDSEGVIEADPYLYTSRWGSAYARLERGVASRPAFRGQSRLRSWVRRTALIGRWHDHLSGADDFNYPLSARLASDEGWRPDLIHAHNLHGDYFDLRALEVLSQRATVIWTLHDAWALTGHCAHFIDCDRWRSGCGHCPDLRRPPAVQRDRTRENWQRKRAIYRASRLAIATPSRWLMGHVEHSMLQPWQQRVVPNGVDHSLYQPGDRRQARAALDLPQDAFIALFVAESTGTTNPYKDAHTVRGAAQAVIAARPEANMRFILIGRSQSKITDPRYLATGYISDAALIVRYYQAADVLLHAANIENFPCVIIEALRCGTPVIATAVGGIPEQVIDGVNGLLVPRNDVAAMAQRLIQLIDQPEQMKRLQGSTAERTALLPSLLEQATNYLTWFDEIQATQDHL
jgi:glycosyltransferase involved in cell wall biosynthesis